MNVTIRLGINEDIDELEQLYNELNDHLANTTNYPGWKKGIYPVREDAIDGIKEGSLYVAISNGKIVASMILRNKPESVYLEAKWQLELNYLNVFVIYTFAVHPNYFGKGVGQALLKFAEEYGIKKNVKTLRLDVYEKNFPAIKLYEKCGFKYIDTVDLGLDDYGLKWFKLYEKVL